MNSSSKDIDPPPHPPVSREQRRAIRLLLKRFLEEHGSRDGKDMSAEACANYIGGVTGRQLSKSVILGVLGGQATNLAYLAQIRDFLLTVYSDVDAETLQSSPTRHLANTLNTLVVKTRTPPFNALTIANVKPAFEIVRLANRENTAFLELALGTGSVAPIGAYKIFPVTAALEIKLTMYPEVPDGLDALIDLRRFSFQGHVVAHNERLTGTLFDGDQRVSAWIGIVYNGPPRPWGARITQIEGDYSPLIRALYFASSS